MTPATMSRSGFTEAERSRKSINQPGESVTLREDFEGAVACRVLVVAGVSLKGSVKAEQVFLNGRVDGKVHAQEMTVGPLGVLDGECHVETLKIAGLCRGLTRARKIVARDGAGLAGEVISDHICAQENVEFDARVAHGKGLFDRLDVLERASARLQASRRPSPVAGEPVAEAGHLVPAVSVKSDAPKAVAPGAEAAPYVAPAPAAPVAPPAPEAAAPVEVASARVILMQAREARAQRPAPRVQAEAEDLPTPFLIASR